MRRIYLLTLLALCLNLAGYAQATAGPFTIESGSDYSWDAGTKTLTITGNVKVKNTSNSSTDGRIVVNGGTSENPLEITLNGISIDVSAEENACAFDVTAGSNVKLKLTAENTVISGKNKAGLRIPPDATVEITAANDDAGKLVAQCKVENWPCGAGIGGNNQETSGTLIIRGGTIDASVIGGGAGGHAAGIGGGEGGSNGTILIEGGKVIATGGSSSTGIGGGNGGNGGTITISGGTVTATGGAYAAGIGGGSGTSSNQTPNCGIITITGGNVIAQGGSYCPGIGHGGWESDGSPKGTIIITGGNITSTGGNWASSDIGESNWMNNFVSTLIVGPEVTFTEAPTIQSEQYSGFVFQKDATEATVAGTAAELPVDMTIPDGKTLTIPAGASLTVSGTLTNNGVIKVSGSITGTDKITGSGKLLYEASFDLNGGEGTIDPLFVESGKKATPPGTTPTRQYYSFEGWFDNEGTSISNKEITEATVFYASWKANEFEVKNVEDQLGTYGSAFTLDLSSFITINESKPCGNITYSLKSGSHPSGLTLNEGTVSGTPTAAGNTPVTYEATAANGVAKEFTVTYRIGKATVAVTPKEGQELYEDEDPSYDANGIIDDDTPLNSGKLGKDGTHITQGDLDLTTDGEKNYELVFTPNVEYTALSGDAKDAVATLPAANREGWYNEEIVFTAPTGFTIALKDQAMPSSLSPKNSGSNSFIWTEEGKDQTVEYTLTRTTTGASYEHSATVSLDKTPPVLTVTPNSLSYTLNADDLLSELKEVTVDNQNVITQPDGSYSGSGTPGSHTAIATDKAGNTISISFNLSNPTPPVGPTPTPTVYYAVTLPAVEGAITNPEAGEYDVESWGDFRFYLTLDKAYDKSLPVVTTDRGETITPRSSDNAYIIKQVRSDVQIRIDGIIKNPAPVANEKIETNHPKVWKTGNELHIQAVTDEPGYIYTPDGKLQTVCHLIAGEVVTVRLPDGIYFVRVGKERFKIVL